MSRYFHSFFIITVSLLLTACLTESGSDSVDRLQSKLEGQILIWHTWDGEEQAILTELLNGFTEQNPKVTIAEETYSEEDIEGTFSYEVEAGLGPDILIAPANLAETLANQNLIRDISNENIDLDIYLTASIDMLRIDEAMYGLPLSLNTFALYYNKSLVEKPTELDPIIALLQGQQQTISNSQTISAINRLIADADQSRAGAAELVAPSNLEELLQRANEGQNIAIPTDFHGAFWGVQTFGGQLFDAEGRVVLNEGGFANWLGWLKQTQDNPFIILDRNHDVLSDLFATGRAAYYVGSTQELPMFQAALGPENIGAIRLPGRQNLPAGPFLQAEALMFSSVSAPRSVSVALALAQYLTNVEQQRRLALSVGKLPSNKRVRIDPRVSPIVAEFIAQSKTAVPISLENIKKYNDVVDLGNDLYSKVLDGEVEVGEAAPLLTQQINEKYGLDTVTVAQQEDCEIEGTINLWNTWTGKKQEVLKTIQEDFMTLCPNVLIVNTDVDQVEFNNRYLEAIEDNQAPVIFTGTNQQLRQLANEDLILNLGDLIDSDFVQRFIPLVGQSMLYGGNIYGIPASVDVMGLYYNTDLVGDPPVVLNDLLSAASPELQVAIPIGFEESFWGIAAFGESGSSVLFDEEKRLIIGASGLSDWLNWLKSAKTQPGMILRSDRAELQNLFIEGQAAFLAAESSQLEQLQTGLGADKVGVVPLPSGSPLLTVDALLISPFTTPEEREIAVMFAQHITSKESQTLLLEQASSVPININVNVTDKPEIDSFVQQVNIGTVIPTDSEVDAVFEWGDLVYEQVLENDIDSLDAVQDFTNLVDATNGFEVAEQVADVGCNDEGEISLWHSWTDIEQIAWQTVISDFSRICTSVQITTTFVPADKLNDQLNAMLEADSDLLPPDFFIGPHTQTDVYLNNGLIKGITALVNKETVVDYLPRSIAALSIGNELYGLPQTLYLPALYYHQDLVPEPAATFEDLLIQVRQGSGVGLNSNFYDLFWGAAAFGCQPCQAGQFFDESGELILTDEDLTEWQTWLQAAARSEDIIFSTDQDSLEQMFLNDRLAYLVAGPDFLNEAQSVLGIANVGLAPLPLGDEEQPSKPFFQVDGFYFYRETTEEETKLALRFVEFATQETKQTLLMQKANFVPVNSLAIATADDSAIVTFISQIETGILLPKQGVLNVIEENSIYRIFDDIP